MADPRNSNDKTPRRAGQDAPAVGRARKRRAPDAAKAGERPKEFGGPKGPEPTRYGDWERKGRAVDF